MDGTVDVSTVVNGWQVLIVAVIIVGPGIAAWLTSISAKRHAKNAADTIVHEVNTNSGSTLRDASDRQEKALAAILARLDTQDDVLSSVVVRQDAQTDVTRDLATRLGSLEGAVERREAPEKRQPSRRRTKD